ncbi:hypothetical protein FJ365_06175 [Candidatus Dependentiae bacterium]|nr:hypothetical protein [Candidatus Dependentiae bacterium]
MLRREFNGAVLQTALAASLSNAAVSFSVVDGSTYPSGTNPFVVVVDRGIASEEKILISSRANNTFTVSERGYDGTTAIAHNAGALVDHILDALTIQDMNVTTYDNEVLVWMGV